MVYVPAAAYVYSNLSPAASVVPLGTTTAGVPSPQLTMIAAGVTPESGKGMLNPKSPLSTFTVNCIVSTGTVGMSVYDAGFVFSSVVVALP